MNVFCFCLGKQVNTNRSQLKLRHENGELDYARPKVVSYVYALTDGDHSWGPLAATGQDVIQNGHSHRQREWP